jgi:ribosome-associated protein
MLNVTRHLQVPLKEIEITFARSSGPGGQNVNKVNSKAVLRWPIATSPSLPDEVRQRFFSLFRRRVTTDGDVVISSQRFRDAPRNQADCLDKLRAMLAEAAAVPKRRKATRPTGASLVRRRTQKQERSRKKQSRRLPADD